MTRATPLTMLMIVATAPATHAHECTSEDALAVDTDGDGVPDVVEIFLETFPDRIDSDGDGLTDLNEIHVLRTDPLEPDSDGDGWCDGGRDVPGRCFAGEEWNENGIVEAALDETDPLCPNDRDPPAPTYPSVRGNTIFGCDRADPGAFVSFALAAVFLTVLPSSLRRDRRARRRAG